MGRLSVILLIAVAFTYSGVEARALKEVRVRTTEKIKYKGFTYTGKHWLEGSALSIQDNILTLLMRQGGGRVMISTTTITEMQIRASSFDEWESVQAPFDEARVQKILQPTQDAPPSIAVPTSGTVVAEASFKVAYIEESGVEILVLHPDLGSTITDSQRVRLGLFRQIENFESAQYIRNVDGTYAVSLTTFDESGMTHTSLKTVSEAGIRSIQRRFTGGREAQSEPIQPHSSRPQQPSPRSTASATSTKRSSNEEMYFYLGGAYHFVPNSEFSDDLEIGLGIDLANTNIQGGSLGAIYRTGARTYADIGIAIYGTQDRTVEFGAIVDVSYSVRSVFSSSLRG